MRHVVHKGRRLEPRLHRHHRARRLLPVLLRRLRRVLVQHRLQRPEQRVVPVAERIQRHGADLIERPQLVLREQAHLAGSPKSKCLASCVYSCYGGQSTV